MAGPIQHINWIKGMASLDNALIFIRQSIDHIQQADEPDIANLLVRPLEDLQRIKDKIDNDEL